MKTKYKIIEWVLVLLLFAVIGGACYWGRVEHKEDMAYCLEHGKKGHGMVYSLEHRLKRGLYAHYVYFDENLKECVKASTPVSYKNHEDDVSEGEFFVVYYHQDVGSFIFLDSLVVDYVDVRCMDTTSAPLTFSLFMELLLILIVFAIITFIGLIGIEKLKRLTRSYMK